MPRMYFNVEGIENYSISKMEIQIFYCVVKCKSGSISILQLMVQSWDWPLNGLSGGHFLFFFNVQPEILGHLFQRLICISAPSFR